MHLRNFHFLTTIGKRKHCSTSASKKKKKKRIETVKKAHLSPFLHITSKITTNLSAQTIHTEEGKTELS